MSRNLSVARKCNELKAELQAGNKKTLVDILLQWIGRGKHLSPMAGIFVFFLLPIIVGLILALVLGELDRWRRLFENFISNPGLFVWVFFGLFTATVSMIVANAYFKSIVVVLSNYVLDLVDTQETLDIIDRWVNLLYNRKYALLTSVIGGALVTPIMVSINSNIAGVFVGIGYTLLSFMFAAQSTLFFGFLLGVLVFSFNVQRFELSLFEADPAHSEVVAQLSGSLNWFVYLVAAYGGVQSFGIVTLKLPLFSSILFIFWIAIVGIFLLSQYGLAQMIQRAKWKTLNRCQQKITEIQKKNSVLKKEDQENIIWLLDYHDRVKATRSSAFDLNAGVSFLNSMLLPLTGFLLGNFDKIIDFFR